MNVIFDRGVYLSDLDLWLDGRVKRAEGFISHAHSDHVARHHRALLTPGTKALLGDLLKNTDCRTLEYGEPLETRNYTMTLYPAGHCLGSAQVLLTSKHTGERTLYTGDLKLKDNPTALPAQPVECDTLVIESTYGHPEYVFPPQAEALKRCYATLRSWLSAGRTPVISVYRLGKAQEILHHLLANSFEVALEPTVWDMTERYQSAGVEFPGKYRQFDGKAQDGEVVIRPPGRRNSSHLAIKGSRTMALTGWAASPAGSVPIYADESLTYSDHADFNELLSYVEAVKPQRVYTVFGFDQLASRLRQLGYNASHLQGKAASQQLRLL